MTAGYKCRASVIRILTSKDEPRRLSHENIYLFKRSCRLYGKDRMHKYNSGKLASQDNLCSKGLHCFAM